MIHPKRAVQHLKVGNKVVEGRLLGIQLCLERLTLLALAIWEVVELQLQLLDVRKGRLALLVLLWRQAHLEYRVHHIACV